MSCISSLSRKKIHFSPRSLFGPYFHEDDNIHISLQWALFYRNLALAKMKWHSVVLCINAVGQKLRKREEKVVHFLMYISLTHNSSWMMMQAIISASTKPTNREVKRLWCLTYIRVLLLLSLFFLHIYDSFGHLISSTISLVPLSDLPPFNARDRWVLYLSVSAVAVVVFIVAALEAYTKTCIWIFT